MLCLELEQIEGYLSGALDDRSFAACESHLASCDACRSALEEVSANLRVAERMRRSSDTLPCPAPEHASTHTIGGYDIERVLGRGSSGVVYQAMQHRPRRGVAIKVLNVGWGGDAHAVRLFRRESQALARLKHPGIAAVLETGITPQGRPFMVIEFVDGEPLLAYARRRALCVRQRVALFRQACEAIAAAHQHGVIHRDLKPAHIMVVEFRREPETPAAQKADVRNLPATTKILDFGLAKFLNPDEMVDAPISLTEQGRVLGTLPYMSPEQARGDVREVDVRSDVYSLGVVLYELLAGARPYEVDPLRMTESVRTICEQPPRRPSEQEPSLRGDLEVIVLKALAKEPAERYGTVAMLSDDLDRWLSNQPVLARPATLQYHLRKLVARHKAPFALAAIMVLLVVAFAVFASVLAFQLNDERLAAIDARQDERAAREEAQQQADIANAVNEFITGMLGSVNPERDGAAPLDTTVAEALTRAAALVGDSFHDQPEVQAAVRFTIGNTYRSLGRLAEARAELSAAADLQRQVHPGGRLDLAQTLNKLGRCLQDLGEYEPARAAFAEALEIRRRLLGPRHADVAVLLNNIGDLARLQGRYDEAERLHREALDIRREAVGERDVSIATGLNNLAIVLYLKGDAPGAEALFRESLAMDIALRPADHPNIAGTMNNLATMLLNRGATDEAEPMLRDVVERLRRLRGENHPSVGLAMFNLGRCRQRQGEAAEAQQLWNQALTLYRQVYGEQHPDIARVLHNLAMLKDSLGEVNESEAMLREALAMRERLLGPQHADTLSSQFALGSMLLKRGRIDEAAPLLESGARAAEAALPQGHPVRGDYVAGLDALQNRRSR